MLKIRAKFKVGKYISFNVQSLSTKFQKTRKYSSVVDSADLAAAYVPKDVETKYSSEEITKYFESKTKKATKETFRIILPPPNITGVLHLGHALTSTIEDVILRWKRMQGYETLWVPGIDHAGIATQVVVEKRLWKERNQTRHDLGRDRFEQEVWKWKQDKGNRICEQLKRMTTCVDWDRMMFTMDPVQTGAVAEAFVRLHDAGLIYRADYLVNWSCVLQSAISDVEVEHLDVKGATPVNVPGYEKPVNFGLLTEFSYKIYESDDEIIVSTTRPETMLGDVAVAVHPDDDRYGRFVGKMLQHPFRNDRIPIVADEFVDKNFGTGAVKITPAHDRDDFEVAKRHTLRTLQVIDSSGNITENFDKRFCGLKRFHAREIVLEELSKIGSLKGTKDHEMTVPVCSRSKDVVELLVKPQWFLDCKEMARKAVDDVKDGRLTIDPSIFRNVWFNWLENIRDWCISRQLWWGHRIPAYFCQVSTKQDNDPRTCWVAARNEKEAKEKAAKVLQVAQDDLVVKQDEDVLDTWFSSALLPFSAFGWPQQTEDLKQYYPLSLMETGHDILFFWVARMVMLGSRLTGHLPFDRILLHGIVCDAHGRKMSKSLGNVVAPEDIIQGITLQELEENTRASYESGILSEEELRKAIDGQRKMFPDGIPACGVDALRFTLCSHNVKSHFINFDISECNTNRLFCNKIWQATKYTRNYLDKVREVHQDLSLDVSSSEDLPKMDKWALSRLDSMLEDIDSAMRSNHFHVATAAIKNFLYYNFCDIYLESTKRDLRLLETNTNSRKATLSHSWTLVHCLEVSLRALAPFMPHLTYHLHQRLPDHPGLAAITSGYPQPFGYRNKQIETNVKLAMEAVTSIRRMKKLFGVTTKSRPEVCIASEVEVYGDLSQVIEDLGGCGRVTMTRAPGRLPNRTAFDTVDSYTTVHLLLPDNVTDETLASNRQRLDKKRAKLQKELDKIRKISGAEAYRLKAPALTQQTNAKKMSELESELSEVDRLRNMLNV